jgi:hypothetical protein
MNIGVFLSGKTFEDIRFIFYGYNVNSTLAAVILGLFGMLLYRGLYVPSSFGRCICFLASKSMGIYLVHTPPLGNGFERLFYHTVFPFDWRLASPKSSLFTQIRFSVTQVMYCVAIEVYREMLFCIVIHCFTELKERVASARFRVQRKRYHKLRKTVK